MDAKRTLSISEARKRIFELAEAVQKPDAYFVLTENGRPKAVMMSADEFESWQETLEVMHDFPDLQKDIDGVERDLKSGAWRDYATLDKLFAKEGYVLADKPRTFSGQTYRASSQSKEEKVRGKAKRQYGVSHHRKTKRKKSPR